jgi:hypothetical protein
MKDYEDEAFDELEKAQQRSMKVEGPLHVVCQCDQCKAQPEQEPEFIKHEVESAKDWSEWVCPNPHKYLMKCCDCGLVHEAQFSVVRYKSEEEREACDFVDDPNMQAVFRMRRSEQWSPEDTAHRAGGLPMAQPEQRSVSEHLEPVAHVYLFDHDGRPLIAWDNAKGIKIGDKLYTAPPQPEQEFVTLYKNIPTFYVRDVNGVYIEDNPLNYYTTPPQRTWVGLMRGVRVEGDTVVISTKDNTVARDLCGALIQEKNNG